MSTGGKAYSEMVQIPALIRAQPDVVMVEIRPNSLWGWNGDGWESLREYHEFRFQLLSIDMASDDIGGWYDILEPNDRKYIDTASIEVLDSWSEYTEMLLRNTYRRKSMELQIHLISHIANMSRRLGPDEWNQYLSKPNWRDSYFDTKSPEEIRQILDEVMPSKTTQGVYNPHTQMELKS